MRRRLLSALFLAGLASINGIAAPVHAQSVTTAAVTGVVQDQEGKAISGATVTVSNSVTGFNTTVKTLKDGRFKVQGLVPGKGYKVEASLEGFETQKRENLSLTLGQAARLDFALGSEAFAFEDLFVVAERNPLLSSSRTGTAASLGQDRITRQPTITRDFTDFARLVPQLTTRGNQTFAVGRNNRFNAIQIDGAVNNDLFGLSQSGTPGGQAGARPITLEAIQEFQVAIAPFDVRQGGFTGATINAITKSGSNEFHGSLAYFNKNQNLVGNYKYEEVLSDPVDTFNSNDVAFSFGGPVVENKLHFFVAGERANHLAPVSVNTAISNADIQRVHEVLGQTYGYDAGSLSNVTLAQKSLNLFGRVDWTINDNHRLTLRHNRVDASDENVARRSNLFRFDKSGYDFTSLTNSTVAQLNSTFGDRIFNELRLGYTTVQDARSARSQFPGVSVTVPGGRVYAGHEQFSGANALDQKAIEITNDLTLALGAHTLTFGTNNQVLTFSNLFVRNAFGYYEFPSIDALEANRPNRFEYSYLLPGGVARPEFPVHTFSLYGQDEWSVGNFVLTGGVRLDMVHLDVAPGQNPLVTENVTRNGAEVRTDVVPENLHINPRFGFNWDVLGNHSTMLRGGVGLFSGRTPGVWLSNPYGNSGLDYTRFTCSGGSAPQMVTNPNEQPRACAGTTRTAPSEINTIDPNYQMPRVFRSTLAIDRELPMGFVGTLEGVYTKAISDPTVVVLTLGEGTGTVEGRARQDRLSTPFSNVTELTNTDLNRSFALTAQVQRNFKDNWELSAAYTHSRSFDVNSTLSSQAFSNWRFNPVTGNPNQPELAVSNFDTPHRVVVTGAKTLDLIKNAPTEVAFAFVGQSGRPFSYTYGGSGSNGDVNFDGANGNDMVYVPNNKEEVRFRGNDAEQEASWQALNTFIESDPCLAEARGTVLKRNACREPWSNRIDVRLAQNVPGFSKGNLQFTVDVLNFGNLLNSSWGVSEGVNNPNSALLTVSNRNPDENGRVLLNPFSASRKAFDASDLASRYQIQIGGRYTF